MRSCELFGEAWAGPCGGRINWHHVWEYAGTQVNEHWAIFAACEGHHSAVKSDRRVREAFERRSLEIASAEELSRYPRRDWDQLKKYLKIEP